MAKQLPYGTQTCPNDGRKLRLTSWTDAGGTETGVNLTCPGCDTEYTEFSNEPGARAFPLIGLGGGDEILGLTSREIDSARDDIRRILERLEIVEPEKLREDLEGVGARIEDAKKSLAALMPDAVDLAYVKTARADIAELRRIVERHVEDSDRQQSLNLSRGANRRTTVGIVIGAVVALLAAAIGAAWPR